MKAGFQSQARSSSGRKSRRRSRRFKTSLGLIFFLAAGAGIFFILAGAERTPGASQTTFDEMRSVPVMEMPARGVEIVGRGNARSRPAVIREVLRSVSVSARPGILPYTVGALLRKFPADFEIILPSAAEFSPSEIVIFAGVAAQACPVRAEDITFILSTNAPPDCVPIAVAVSREVPGAKHEILRGLTNAVPRLAAPVEVATRVFGVDDFEFVLQNALDRIVEP